MSRTRCQVVVLGDSGTGKSSLIAVVATDYFPAKAPPVLPPTRLPTDFFPDRVPLTIIDTSSRKEDKARTVMECKKADAIVLTYACDRPTTLERLSTYWLPELRLLDIQVPVIVVGCKLDLRDDRQPSLEQAMAPLMHEFREVETCIECSSMEQIQVAEVFYNAQKAILHPIAPLFDQETRTLKPRCVRALTRIFILCDHDRDGTLNDAELNDFQMKCFSVPLQPLEIVEVKKVVSEKISEGLSNDGLTLTGFLFLHTLFIVRGRLETTWTVLRKFGYDDEIKIRDDLVSSPSFKRAADQSVELTEKALDFLRGVFSAFDVDGDGALRPQKLEELFLAAPSSPWKDSIYSNAGETNSVGGLMLNGFLSLWALMTLLEPQKSLAHLIYTGFPGEINSAFRITPRRRQDKKRQWSQRVVFQAFVFGASKSGKSALLNALVGRDQGNKWEMIHWPYSEPDEYSKGVHIAANFVEQIGGSKKTLILRKIAEESVASLLENKDALADCDVAVFVYDSSDAASLNRACELLVEITAHGEITGHEVPCLLIATEDDLEPDPSCIVNSTRVCTEMGVDAPISVSMKVGDIGDLFRRIVEAAQRPHLSIPETEQGRIRKHRRRLIQRSLAVAAVGATVTVAGIAVYRVYSRRKAH